MKSVLLFSESINVKLKTGLDVCDITPNLTF